ncbi:MAG: DNA-directed RNA polymerase subunit beta [Candidatus Komeilibacteria bacterium CG11_big_fil_rev_8_21_14_0_20_36_20]|uniref:DNA-directed RNA polymerase subunit beta n=1 Tax=Candidatus Komeilibacteria bacterium CG11_big_fil_rev_8_21_14_0_20_36_20 TaxID=1974477 RepID=A0A2H0NCK6_9BACT|nr:MAG: DNA-directed RNA polymerase subunit beta [Candidatus Komeilibacteria bacterium CG11_big_fil_rev_8_21_14_0_20_36_20]PIR81927.1 MAG: DNA-directed RNA polymerase subunit beta [Candidatus Komeilibacteria bacterium CG10_big_fil_rev_8_21_14_0_10_36_65]PJC55346.1 MAG: DNA-directed RNA polymerase subunit beta [Candidatus Komeilibacteria bacterium CG_4_9_14_0_2_um_filter_36_13]
MPQTKILGARKYFTTLREAIPLTNLIEVQKKSYDWFFAEGLKELFEEISPITDFIGRDLELHFLNYYLDEPKFDEVTAKSKNISYESPIRVNVRLINKKTNEVKEQEVYLGDFPLMTERGTFIINGVERVVVSQLIRSAGVFFTSEMIKGRKHYGAKIIPNRGAWLEIETEASNVIYVKIDRKRKVPITALFRAFGYATDEEIISLFKDVDNHPEVSFIKNTLEKDVSHNEPEGLKEVYRRIRPGDLATTENARSLIHSMFFHFDRYDFGRVGRYKINARFDLDIPNTKETRVLRREDLILVIQEIIKLNLSQEEPDDIDHLGNRRVRAIGELVQNRFRIGLARMERIIKDRMSTLDVNSLTPNQLINARPVVGVTKEFFMSSQLSQFMDQVNPLAELEHKRRLSAMGPGGLSRERAGFEVRDVHRTHYGRICPIATPEGPNIGLVGHLASYAKVNDFGFIETPFRRVWHDLDNEPKQTTGKIARINIVDPKTKNIIIAAGEIISPTKAKELAKNKEIKKVAIKPIVTKEIVYLDAFEEERYNTAAATTPIDEDGYFVNNYAEIRVKGNPMYDKVENIDLLDVAPNQIISIATSLIPFLEHDDAVRALMGTNMQRQAVSVIRPESPIVGTGVEAKAAIDSGQVVVAKESGKVTRVDSRNIDITNKDGVVATYNLNKFSRSNTSTSMNQHPIVNKGDEIKKGVAIADGAATDQGELALGQNMLVAYMTWQGGNYEDAILISERVVKDDNYTSISIEDYSIDIRDTKLGPEVITRDIPNVSEEKLKDLDSEGIVRIGANVSSGDILVGKITPKGETELSAEEKLLRAIFGEKAKDVRDTSLYLKHGERGKVVDIKIFSRDKGDKLPAGVINTVQVTVAQLRKIQVGDKMAGRHGNKGVISRVVPEADMPFLADGTPVDIILNPLGVISRMNLGQLLETHLGLAARTLGYKVASPSLNGVDEEAIRKELAKAGWPEDGKIQLYDGYTGKPFDNRTTVGIAYMLKLNHLVEDKIHQRSIGPYSLVTQQPLGGKAQFGGQRFGEMEVWALEAYGAANTLQEMITIKSDDVPGRSKAYESIIKGEPIERLNIPESFNVLVRELKGLGLDVELIGRKETRFKEENREGSQKIDIVEPEIIATVTDDQDQVE